MDNEILIETVHCDDSGLSENERIEFGLLKCMEYSVTHGKLPKGALKRIKQLESKLRWKKKQASLSEYDEKHYGKHVDAVDSLPF